MLFHEAIELTHRGSWRIPKHQPELAFALAPFLPNNVSPPAVIILVFFQGGSFAGGFHTIRCAQK
ncbi:MAG: hypothetical protein GWN64_04115 [Candidatus Thorarchaeota archaeon]|nr:hypothetical protein [Candidatus Thorarchaeota archaeon]